MYAHVHQLKRKCIQDILGKFLNSKVEHLSMESDKTISAAQRSQ